MLTFWRLCVEITTAYKHLQTLKSALDRIVSDVLPLSGVSDVEAFEGELRNLKGKAEVRTLLGWTHVGPSQR